jgi:hypothetical protein
MSLENRAVNKWLERLDSDREEIERLLANADGHLSDYRKSVESDMSADAQLSLAYDAIRASATAALRASGYRVVRGGAEHYRTIEALEFSIDPERKLIPRLDALRRKRNTGAYDDYGLVAQREADLAPPRAHRCEAGSQVGPRSVADRRVLLTYRPKSA